MATSTTHDHAIDLVALEEAVPEGFELIDGMLSERTGMSFPYGRVCNRVARDLSNHVLPKNLGEVVVSETGFVIGRDPITVLKPDVAFVAKARVTDALLHADGFAGIVPDLAIEVVSPNERLTAVMDKVGRYLAAGVRRVWIMEPKRRCVTVHAPGKAPETIGPEGVLDGGDVIPGLRLPVADIFP